MNIFIVLLFLMGERDLSLNFNFVFFVGYWCSVGEGFNESLEERIWVGFLLMRFLFLESDE